MSFHFGKSSLDRLSTCHPDLQRIANEIIKEMDVSVLCGHRDEMAQIDAFNNGMSRLTWPHSKHNKMPSEAMDIAPYNAAVPDGVDWSNVPLFMHMLNRIEEIADSMGIKIKLGRDFSFRDWPHVELHPKNKK